MSAERLQKVLARAGIASRRDCEAYIAAGRVMVNGRVVRIPGTRVDPEHDEILVDGKPIGKIHRRTYVMLHKPAGVVSTTDDPQGRPTVIDLVNLERRLFPVGRLDYDSEGLLLLTDDGELTQKLTHPRYQVEKEYRVLLNEAPSPSALRAWRTGVELDGVKTAPAWVELIERTPEGAWVRVILHEGRKRQIREVARLLGYEVRRLIRVREGPLTLGDLPSGAWRFLTDEEVEMLREHAEQSAAIAEAEQSRRREQDEAKAAGGRRLQRISPSARLLQKGKEVKETTLPELDEMVDAAEEALPMVEKERWGRHEKGARRAAPSSRNVHADDRSGRRRDRQEDRRSGYRSEQRRERGSGGAQGFRRSERSDGYRSEQRDERRSGGARDVRREARNGGYRSERQEDRSGRRRNEQREARGSGGVRDVRREARGSGGVRDIRREARNGGYRNDRCNESGSDGARDVRRDEHSGGYRSERREDRNGGRRNEQREERGLGGARDVRREARNGGYRNDRRDDRSGGRRGEQRNDRSGGYRSGWRNERGSRGFSRNDRPALRYSEDDEK
ncbi:MAG: pseudouridine synthase [Roseiflexaceae bacterium]|nr:pseudouridine synthase [Roseiflexus sp.]MCS7288271.1 pseudouridine synthase [Roseiflexus sp.]MDW8214984.1 pseudouridine synthase [Roseiflexaceae bacterium]